LVYRGEKRKHFSTIRTVIFSLVFGGVVFWHSRRKSLTLVRFNWRDAITGGRSRLRATGIFAIASPFSGRTTTVSALTAQVVNAALRRLPSNGVDNLYFELSARIAAHAVAHETEDWFGYFEWLRALVVRVVSESTEGDLTAAEKNALIQRLDNYVTDLEDLWPILNSERILAGPARGHPERAVARQ
jgi:hypothetical protein